jgi:class 3 adenylate cyclase
MTQGLEIKVDEGFDYKRLYEEQLYVNHTIEEFSQMLLEDPLNEGNEQKYFKYILKKVGKLLGFSRGALMLIKNKDKRLSNFGSILEEGKYLENAAFIGLPNQLENIFMKNEESCELIPTRGPSLYSIKLKKPIQICNNDLLLKELESKKIISNKNKYLSERRKEYLKGLKEKKLNNNGYNNFDDFIREIAFPLLWKNDVLGAINFDAPKDIGIKEPIPEHTIYSGMEITNSLIPLILNSIVQNRIIETTSLFTPSKKLVELAIRDPDKFKELERGNVWDITNLFIDIQSYSAYSEEKNPKDIVSRLRDYYELVGGIAEDKYNAISPAKLGDGAFYVFNGMNDQEDHANRAVECAMEIQKKLTNSKENTFTANVGIYTGLAMMGNYYRENSIAFGPIGNSVNSAARLCGKAKDGGIYISDSTYKQTYKKDKEINSVGMLNVKNIKKPIKVYSVKY